MTKRDFREIEFKWSVKSAKEFAIFLHHAKKMGIRIGPAKKISIVDTYLDTRNGMFAKSGIKTRIRRANQKWELTQKRMSKLRRGLARRQEKTIRLPNFDSVIQTIQYASKEFLQEFLCGKHACVLFTIRNQRIARKLKITRKTSAELCFDQTVIKRGKKSVVLKEIELEFLKGRFSEFKKFISAITHSSSLKPAKISKVATALKTFGLKT